MHESSGRQPRRWLKTRSFGASLAFAFGGVLALATVATAVAVTGLQRVSAQYEEALGTGVRIAMLADEAERELLEARRREKDFLLRWREEGLEEARKRYVGPLGWERPTTDGDRRHHRDHVDSLEAAVGELRRVVEVAPKGTDHSRPLVRALAAHPELEGGPGRYRALFERTVQQIEQRGHEDEGLVGDMRRAAHELEDWVQLRARGRTQAGIGLALLQLRRAEKDYLLRGSTSWAGSAEDGASVTDVASDAGPLVADVNARSDSLREQLTALGGSQVDAPLAHLARFDETFAAVVELDQEIATTEDAFRAEAAQIQVAVSEVASTGRAAAEAHFRAARARHTRTARLVLVCVIAMLLLACSVAWALARQIQIPVRQLESAARRIGAGDFTTRAEITSEDEFGTLATTFNDLVERIQRVLENLLPRSIARIEIRQEGQLIAEKRSQATVLFADIVGYTRISSHLTPREVVERLSAFFDAFDQLAAEHGVVKIKTIGDNYMAAAGVLDEAAAEVPAIERMADFALAMRAVTHDMSRGQPDPFDLRIGLHTGEVVAGVIGQKRRIFDLWGHTVNVASRMESYGVSGRIHVTEAVSSQLEARFQFEPLPEKIQVKNVEQPMQTSFLLRRRAERGHETDPSQGPG